MKAKYIMNRLYIAAAIALLAMLSPSSWAAKQPPGGDPGNNNLPPAGAILDLAGTPIPGGGNSTYQMYTTSFTATSTSTAITFAFREDPAFISFSNPSVIDQANAGVNLLVDADFSGGTFTSSGNSSTPVGWTYANVYGATFGGVLQAGCGVTGGFCWYDGAVQAYDALTQTIATTIGHQYKISFWIADNSECTTQNGPISPCNFSQLSTNGDTTDVGGNGIDVLAYTGAALPAPAAIHLELTHDQSSPNQGIQALATARSTGNNSVDMQTAAQAVGFDHFNWLQIIVNNLLLSTCAGNASLAGCASHTIIGGSVAPLPTVDPPLGGWAYEFWATNCPGHTCAFTSPVQDYSPMYWDEYFAPGTPVSVGGRNYTPYVASPTSPEYKGEYRQGNTVATQGSLGISASQALGFSYSDMPGTSYIVPTTGSPQNDTFVTALVGVTGTCNSLGSGNCGFQIFPGSTFKWNSTNGVISVLSPPISSAAAKVADTAVLNAKVPDDFPVNPVDFTGAELSGAMISTEEFLTLANLTPQSLAAMGGGISIFSVSLVPTQAAALAVVEAGGTLVPPTGISVVASGLAYSRVTQTFNGTMTLQNMGSSTLTGPLQLLFNGLPQSVTVVNAAGNFAGTPYLTIGASALAPGQSVVVSVQIKNPGNVSIDFTPSVYSGSVQ
jgi:hypothetical protein